MRKFLVLSGKSNRLLSLVRIIVDGYYINGRITICYTVPKDHPIDGGGSYTADRSFFKEVLIPEAEYISILEEL